MPDKAKKPLRKSSGGDVRVSEVDGLRSYPGKRAPVSRARSRQLCHIQDQDFLVEG